MQVCASTGIVVAVAGGIVVVTGAGGGVCEIQPARKTAAMQKKMSIIVFLSILKIGCNYIKPDGDYRNYHRSGRIATETLQPLKEKLRKIGKKKIPHSTFAHTYANRWNAVMCPKIPKNSSSQPNQLSQ